MATPSHLNATLLKKDFCSKHAWDRSAGSFAFANIRGEEDNQADKNGESDMKRSSTDGGRKGSEKGEGKVQQGRAERSG